MQKIKLTKKPAVPVGIESGYIKQVLYTLEK